MTNNSRFIDSKEATKESLKNAAVQCTIAALADDTSPSETTKLIKRACKLLRKADPKLFP